MGASQSTTSNVELTFVARKGKEIAGFRTKRELVVTAKSIDTLATVLANFNQYRGPTTQISTLYDAETGIVVGLETVTENAPRRLYIN